MCYEFWGAQLDDVREVTLPAIMQARDEWKASPAGQAVQLKFAAVPAAPVVVPAAPAAVPALVLNVASGAVGPDAVAVAIKLPTGPALDVVPPAVGAPGQPASAAVLVAAQTVLAQHLATMQLAAQRGLNLPVYNPLSTMPNVTMDWAAPPHFHPQPSVIEQSSAAPVGESPLVLFVLFI